MVLIPKYNGVLSYIEIFVFTSKSLDSNNIFNILKYDYSTPILIDFDVTTALYDNNNLTISISFILTALPKKSF